ncbi:MAG: ABC transporter permease subunit [Clostridia bacterium]|nr:ABC transporter permease subunit [Clostridia bacterium]
MKAVYNKELKSFFTTPMGMIFIAFMLLVVGLYTWAINFIQLMPNFEYALYSATLVYLFFIPVLTMRSIAEEKRNRTEQLLFSAPVTVADIVLGKYFAMLTILAIPLVITAAYPLIISMYGAVNFASAYLMLFAFFLLGAALTAIGMFISSMTENQLIAAVLSLAAMLMIYFMNSLINMVNSSSIMALSLFTVFVVVFAIVVYSMTNSKNLAVILGFVLEIAVVVLYSMFPEMLITGFDAMLSSFALFNRLNNFYFGMLDLGALAYYLSVCALFVLFTVQSIEKRRWS